MNTYLLHYSNSTNEASEEIGDIACFVEGRLCLFTLLRSNNPNPKEDLTRDLFCRGLEVKEVGNMIFYQLNSYRDKASGKYFLLPRATRYYFKVDKEKAVVVENALSLKLDEESDLFREISKHLYLTDIAAQLNQVF